jgi:probable non-F420 flavinoid oxidoreductase
MRQPGVLEVGAELGRAVQTNVTGLEPPEEDVRDASVRPVVGNDGRPSDQPAHRTGWAQARPGREPFVPIVSFHASHEQLSPGRLIEAVRAAEEAGFQGVTSSDHLAPWSERQGESGYAWSWLGAALQATSIPIGVVTAPGQRYHPAIVGQAIATLAEMFPDRFWVALGSGEALNEHVTGDPWPPKGQRDQRLLECVAIIRALLSGEEVSHRGLVTVDRARVWSLPDRIPLIFGAAVSEQTAGTVGGWADGLITVHQPGGRLRSVIDAFREGGGGTKPVCVQVHLSWAATEAEALRIAHDQWRTNVFGSEIAWNLELPQQFDEAARRVRPEDVRDSVFISADPEQHVTWLHEIMESGVDELSLHHVGPDQRPFIDAFAEHVLPKVIS